jgi:hypothetical protein
MAASTGDLWFWDRSTLAPRSWFRDSPGQPPQQDLNLRSAVQNTGSAPGGLLRLRGSFRLRKRAMDPLWTTSSPAGYRQKFTVN